MENNKDLANFFSSRKTLAKIFETTKQIEKTKTKLDQALWGLKYHVQIERFLLAKQCTPGIDDSNNRW